MDLLPFGFAEIARQRRDDLMRCAQARRVLRPSPMRSPSRSVRRPTPKAVTALTQPSPDKDTLSRSRGLGRLHGDASPNP